MVLSTSIPTFKKGRPVLYEICVDTGNMKPYTVYRRYNDFLKLAADVEIEMGEPVTVPPPPKPSIWQSVDYEQRRIDLEIMLSALVRIPEFAQSLAVNNFLEVYSHRSAIQSQDRTADWVHATTEISTLITQARSSSSEHKTQVRQYIVQAKALVGQLQRSINNGTMQKLGSGENARRQQQLDNYLVSIRQLESRTEAASTFGGGRSKSIEPMSTGSDETSRVLGETSETRRLNNTGLLENQEQIMETQDDLVEGLRAAISRQKELGLAINEEIVKQNELLDDLDTDVHRVNARLNEARRKTERLNR